MEARVTSREEQNIVQWGIAVVQMTDPLEATTCKRMMMSRCNGLV